MHNKLWVQNYPCILTIITIATSAEIMLSAVCGWHCHPGTMLSCADQRHSNHETENLTHESPTSLTARPLRLYAVPSWFFASSFFYISPTRSRARSSLQLLFIIFNTSTELLSNKTTQHIFFFQSTQGYQLYKGCWDKLNIKQVEVLISRRELTFCWSKGRLHNSVHCRTHNTNIVETSLWAGRHTLGRQCALQKKRMTVLG